VFEQPVRSVDNLAEALGVAEKVAGSYPKLIPVSVVVAALNKPSI
jgi:hypothetical protein